MNKKKNIKQSVELVIDQDMSIMNAGAHKGKIVEGLNSCSSMVFTLKNIEVIDLTGIQLIYALKKEAKIQNKILHLNFDLNTDILETIRLAGFGDLLEN